MTSRQDIGASSTRRALPLSPLATNNPPHAPFAVALQLAPTQPHRAPLKARGHGRTRSFLTGLLKPSAGPKRSSLPPPARPSQVQLTASDAGLRAPSVQRKRISAPVDFKGKSSVSSPRLLPSPFSQEDSATRPMTRSSSYLDTKPLPLDGEQKMRISSWDFRERDEPNATAAPDEARNKGKGRAYVDVDVDRGMAQFAQQSAWDGWVRSVADDHLRMSASMPAGISRLSIASDTPSTIAFPGPSLSSPDYASIDPYASRFSISGGHRHLSPIAESEGSTEAGSRYSYTPPVTVPARTTASTVTSRPILHIDPSRLPSRKPSNMSMSVYSRQSVYEHEGAHAYERHAVDDEDDTPREPEPPLGSYFSPDTPAPRSLEGLAISGADTSPTAPPVPLLEAQAVLDPLPSPALPSQFALSAKPSFSGFRFPSTSSIATSTSTVLERAPSFLFDDAPGSTLTTATSTFEAGPSSSSDAASLKADVEERVAPAEYAQGVWREDWRWSMLRRSLLFVEKELAPELPLDWEERRRSEQMASPETQVAPALRELARTAPVEPPNGPAPVEAPVQPTPAEPAPVLLPLSALPPHLLEKALPPIPDNASIFSGPHTRSPEDEDEVVRIEVYCQRELVRKTKDRHERYVIERTLLYGEDVTE